MMAMTASTVTRWTLDQLAERVWAALSVDYDGQASGRVREVPDQRAIRYYTTIGLVDRPAAMRGRTALYVRRHLLQLVAIKRLQARGLSLARIQRELAGATDTQLERVARIPPLEEPAGAAQEAEMTPAGAFDAAPAPTGAPLPAPTGAPLPTPTGAPLPAPRPAFWKRAAQSAGAAPPGFRTATSEAEAAGPRPHAATPPAPGEGGAVAMQGVVAGEGVAVAIQGVRLGDRVTLLVEGAEALGADEVAAIRAAAGPLLDLVRRGRERS
jgi:DNA-binding transcriptional MerR regulator